MREKIVRYAFDPADPPPLTEEQRDELARHDARGDEGIDFTDIPLKLDWSTATRGRFHRPVKQQLTLRLDADVVHWFKANSVGGGYQTRINAALRRFVEEETRDAG